MTIADNHIYDRSCEFSKNIIRTVRTIKQDSITRPLINQLVRSATSIGANLSEATFGASRKDFINKITITLKEAKETAYWIELLCSAGYINPPDAIVLKGEIIIINKILSTIKLNTVEKVPSKTLHP